LAWFIGKQTLAIAERLLLADLARSRLAAPGRSERLQLVEAEPFGR
jgi:hypothetical protein